MFSGNMFSYGGIASSTYGLRIVIINTEAFTSIGGNLEYTTYKSKSNPKTSIIDSQYTEPISFDIEFMSDNPISDNEFINIVSWLGNTKGYKRLIINDNMYNGYHLNCYFTDLERFSSNYNRYGIKCTVNCDSSFMWSDTIFTQTYTTFPFSINNNTAQRGYIYPKVVITVGSIGGQIKIQNVTDDNRLTVINDTIANEVITLKSNPKTIEGNMHENIYENFNKKWFRLLEGINNVGIIGDIISIRIEYEKARVII